MEKQSNEKDNHFSFNHVYLLTLGINLFLYMRGKLACWFNNYILILIICSLNYNHVDQVCHIMP